MIFLELALEVCPAGMLAHLLKEYLVLCDALKRLDQVRIQQETITNFMRNGLKLKQVPSITPFRIPKRLYMYIHTSQAKYVGETERQRDLR